MSLTNQRYDGLDVVIGLIIDGKLMTVKECKGRLRQINGGVYVALEEETRELAKDPMYQTCLNQARKNHPLPTADTFLDCDLERCKEFLDYLDENSKGLDIAARKRVESRLDLRFDGIELENLG